MSFRRILVASDLGLISDAPMRRALELGRELSAQLFALHVNEAPHDESEHWLSPFFGPELEAYRAVTRRHEECQSKHLGCGELHS